MTRRKSTPTLDPIETMHKAMRLAESCAAREQQKGEHANLKIMAEHMMQAASLAEKIAQIQDRRGIVHENELPPKVSLEIIARCMDCGKLFDTADMAPERSPADKLPRTIDGQVVKREAIPLHLGGAHPASKPAAPKPVAAKPVDPPKSDVALYNPKFHAGGPVKVSAVSGSFDQFLSVHKAPTEFKP